MGLINQYLRPLLQKLSLRSLHKRVEAIADSPVAAKNGDDFKANMDPPEPAPKVSESKPLPPPNKVRVTSEEKGKTLNGGLKKASKKKGKELSAASIIMQESRTRIAATPIARTSSANSLSRLIGFGNKGSNRGDGSGTDEVDDGALWRNKILMGKRCKPLELDGGVINSELAAAAAEAVNGVKGGPAMTAAEERNRIAVSSERKCLDEDFPFLSREELDTNPYFLGGVYIADICSDYNVAATSSDSSKAGSAIGGNCTRSLARSDSGKVLWSTTRRRSMSVVSRYLGKVKKTLMRERRRRPRKEKGSATPLFTSRAWGSETLLCECDDGWADCLGVICDILLENSDS